MRTIYKIPVTGEPFKLPFGAEFLSLQMQGVDAVAWFLVDSTARAKTWRFIIIWTGHPVPDDLDMSHYVGTVQAGGLVHHVFLQREGD